MNIPLSLLAQASSGGGSQFMLILTVSLVVVGLGMLIFFFSRYQKCPSDRILVIYGKTSAGKSSKCLHGGAVFVWPVIQAYEFLDLTPIPIEINNKYRPYIAQWLLIMFFLVSIMIIIGGLTRLTDSGLSITVYKFLQYFLYLFSLISQRPFQSVFQV